MGTAKPATLPAVNARMRNRLSSIIGSATLLSITTNAASSTTPPASRPKTEADRHVDPEHRPPIQGRQHSPSDQADELAGQTGDLIDAQRKTALIARKRIGQDRGRVGSEHRPAHCLEHPPADQPQRSVPTVERIERKQDGGDGEHREAGVVDPDPTEHVAEAAHGDDENGPNEPIPRDHPQQVDDVAGASGSRWMPRKIAGSAIRTIDPSSCDMNTARVVFDKATHS